MKAYIAIDLKSFYASVECREKNLDPLDTNLVVADLSRTEKTICLAVSPSLKAWGIPGRARLFEVAQRVREVNAARARRLLEAEHRTGAQSSLDANAARAKGLQALNHRTGAQPALEVKEVRNHKLPEAAGSAVSGPDAGKAGSGHSKKTGEQQDGKSGIFSGKSSSAAALAADPSLELSYEVATPRMSLYMDYSARIYNIYMKYVAPEDVHVYSVDEVFIDAAKYLDRYQISAHELAMRMMRDVLAQTGITATAGIGTNLYLAKVAMDIVAKHVAPDADGVRIAQLDERTYRKRLWAHRPLTDFWRVGRGYAKKLQAQGLFTMGDIARCSLEDEDLLYSLFGVNAELLIDHAWGWEPCTIAAIKAYQPQNRSFSHGQVLQNPYDFQKARVVVHEMADEAALDLVEKRLTTDQLTLTVGYDIASAAQIEKKSELQTDRYGRKVPRHAHGTASLRERTSSSNKIDTALLELFDRIVDPRLLVRRITITVNRVQPEKPADRTSADRINADRTYSAKIPKGGASADSLSEGLYSTEGTIASSAPAEVYPTDDEPAGGTAEGLYSTEGAFGGSVSAGGSWQQLDLFTDYAALEKERERERAASEKERRLQEAMLSIRSKYGKNAILKGINFKEGATGRERNQQVGGHKA